MKALTALFNGIKPLNTSHELELLRIKEMDVLNRIDRQGKVLAQAYIEHQLGTVKTLANLQARSYEELIVCLIRTEECHAKLLHERKAPQSTRIDYTRFDKNTY